MRVLEVVSFVAASSPDAARGLSDAGLLHMPRAVLLSGQWASPITHPLARGPDSASRAAAVVGCLRLWRACVPARVFFTTLDDAFPCILALLAWAQRTSADAADAVSDLNPPAEAAAVPETPELYIPDASKQRVMRARLGECGGGVAISGAASGDGAAGGSGGPQGWHGWAIAHTAVQEIALLVTMLLQHDIPAQAPQPAWMERRSFELPEDCAACDAMCSAGCIQQLAPHLLEFLTACTIPSSATAELASWPAAGEWLQALAADADAAEHLQQELPARQQEEAQHQLPQLPPAMHAALLQPRESVRQGAINACLLAVDALATPRSPESLPVVADRSALLKHVTALPCCSVLPPPAQATATDAAPLQQCLKAADAAEAAAVRAAVAARAASAARRAGDNHAGPGVAVLAQACVQAARAVVGIGAGPAAAASVALSFGPWAAVRTHATHLAAAGLLRCLRMLAAVSGGQLPVAFAERSGMLAVLRALVLVPTLTLSADTARQAMQLLFTPAISALCSTAAAQALHGNNRTMGPSDTSQLLVPGPALLAAYAAAWTGCGPPAPLSGEPIAAAAEPVPEALPRMWMDAASGAGQRLPAPPDWFVLAVAARVDAGGGGGDAPPGAPASGDLSAAVLAAAVMWVLGLVHSGACRAPAEQSSPALSQGWNRQSVRLSPPTPYAVSELAAGRWAASPGRSACMGPCGHVCPTVWSTLLVRCPPQCGVCHLVCECELPCVLPVPRIPCCIMPWPPPNRACASSGDPFR